MRDSLMSLPEITILQMIYQQKTYEAEDHEFSATSMRASIGKAVLTIPAEPWKWRDWLTLPEDGIGIVVRDVHRERDY